MLRCTICEKRPSRRWVLEVYGPSRWYQVVGWNRRRFRTCSECRPRVLAMFGVPDPGPVTSPTND